MSLFAFSPPECDDLAVRCGRGAFYYRAGLAAHLLRELRRHLPRRVRVAYAVKANPHPALLRELADEGASFDVASAGELDRVLELGVPGSRILFAGPGKSRDEIERIVVAGARLQAEGWEDLERAEQVAEAAGVRKLPVNLRVHPLGIDDGSGLLGGSGPSAFGVDEETLGELLPRVAGLRRVHVTGLHCFAAGNELDASRLARFHRRGFEIAARLARELGSPIDQIDLGGGLGVPYAAEQAPLDLGRLGHELDGQLGRNPWFAGEVVLEPGRFLAAPIGIYVTEVIRTKRSRGEHVVILAGGINHLLRPLLTGEPFPVRVVGPPRSGAPRPTILAGPLCTALDRLGRVLLPPLTPGDRLAFGMAGAYGAGEAMPRFLSHRPAAEHWVERDATTG